MSKLSLILLLILFAAAPLRAQAVAPVTDATAAAMIDQAGDDLSDAMTALRRRTLSDAEIRAQLAEVPPIRADLDVALASLKPHLADADARLAQLGPAPARGQPAEAAETAATRAALAQARGVIDAEVKQARLLAIEADQITATLNQRLRDNFSHRLWTQSRSVLDPGLWREFATSTPIDLGRLAVAGREEARVLSGAARRTGAVAALIIAILFGFALAGPGRAILNRWGYRRADADAAPEPLRRSGVALWLVAVAVVTALVAGLLVRAALIGEGVLTPVFAQVATLAVRGVVFAATLEALGRAVLSPGRPRWRMAPLSDEIVARLSPYPGLIGLAAGLASIITGLNTVLGASLSSSVASDCCVVLIELAAVGAGLATAARAREAHLAMPDMAAGRASGARLPWVLAALAAWLALIGALVAVLTGYLALAGFLMRETVWIGAVLALMFLLLRFTDEAFPALFAPASRVGRLIETGLGLSRSAMEQIGVLAAGVARLALLLLGWVAILAPFGAGADDVITKMTSTASMLQIGRLSLSPGALVGAVALLLVGLAATRAVRGWLERQYLPKTRLDVGLRTSATSAVTYMGAAVAILAAFAYLGVSLSQMALLAGALSVGIGFGLQSIIGNFVSGLILLGERPIAVGDWVAIGEWEGDVRRINIRATEIEMADKSKLIVPNSDLVSKIVRNVTHAGAAGRVKIVLKIDDGADPGVARDLLLDRLTGHAEVLREPAPAVYLSDVRDGALEFTAFAYVASPRQAFRVKSDLLFQIVPDLKAGGLALANATPIINVDLADRAIAPEPTDAA